MTPEEKLARLKNKCYHQKLQLRSLNKALRLSQLIEREAIRGRNAIRDQFQRERKAWSTTDYRSVCRCWTCRVRRYWQFITKRAHTYD